MYIYVCVWVLRLVCKKSKTLQELSLVVIIYQVMKCKFYSCSCGARTRHQLYILMYTMPLSDRRKRPGAKEDNVAVVFTFLHRKGQCCSCSFFIHCPWNCSCRNSLDCTTIKALVFEHIGLGPPSKINNLSGNNDITIMTIIQWHPPEVMSWLVVTSNRNCHHCDAKSYFKSTQK